MEENNCKYLCSMGFKKSCDIILTDEKTIMDYDYNKLNNGDVLYVKTDFVYSFFKIINNINKNFVLVTGSSDYTMPNDIFHNHHEFINFLENNKIIKWFAENCVYEHPKIINLPIGLDYHTMSNSDHEWGRRRNPIEQESELIAIKSNSKPFYKRINKIYSNCHFLTWTKFGHDRIDALNKIPNNLLELENHKVNRFTTWLNQIKYTFVLSPHGNGLDCHRTWEALILGCIPIVKTSQIDNLYIDLPVLIVKNWEEITEELLTNTIENFKNRSFKNEKLTLKYWINNFKM